MSDTPAVKPPAPTDLSHVRDTMERNELLLSAKTQSLINQLKNLDRHFYSVGKYKAADGTWQDKMEPDAFAVQTMGTLQAINTEVLSMIWENPDDLLNAAVTVRVRGWKGTKDAPAIEKTVELRLSMKAIAAKYVMDKLEPKKKWNDQSRRKEETPAEWKEEDVTLRDDGWVQPKSFKHQVAMRSYLIDQFSFLGRMAESKAERRVNLKLLGFDWRDPDEINDEGRETAAVAAAKPEAGADPAPCLAAIDQCKTDAEIDALTPTLTVETGKMNEDDRQKVFLRLKERRDAIKNAPKPAPVATATKQEHPQDPTAMSQDEFQEFVEALKAHDTLDGLTALWDAVIVPSPKTVQQHADLEDAYQRAVDALDTKAEPKTTKKKPVPPTSDVAA